MAQARNCAFLFNMINNMDDYKNVKRWQDLSEADKNNYYKKFSIVVDWLKANKNRILPWEKIDGYVGHVYRLTIDNWNASHYDPMGKLEFDDNGMKYSWRTNEVQ